jgi:hypothetical protein
MGPIGRKNGLARKSVQYWFFNEAELVIESAIQGALKTFFESDVYLADAH